MAIQDKTITLKGDQTVVIGLGLAPHDGKITLTVAGETKDSAGNKVGLSNVSITVDVGQIAVIDNLLARALTELRKGNGLE